MSIMIQRSRAMIKLSRAAGADVQLLAQCSKSSQIKYGSLGGLVFLLSIMSAGTFTYALDIMLTRPDQASLWLKAVTYGIGGFWLIMILNLFRLIVSSTGNGDGTMSMKGSEVLSSIFSTCVAVVLGICFGLSVAVFLFNGSIGHELSADQIDSIKTFNSEVDIHYHDKLKDAYIQKAVLFEKFTMIDPSEAFSWEKAKKKYLNQIAIIASLQQEIIHKKENHKTIIINSRGFFTVVAMIFDNHLSITVLMMLFGVLIHSLPILSKRIFWAKGTYEYLVDFQNEITLSKNGIVKNAGRFIHGGKEYGHDRFFVAKQLFINNATAHSSNLNNLLPHHENLYLKRLAEIKGRNVKS